jgi:hypothetical protein
MIIVAGENVYPVEVEAALWLPAASCATPLPREAVTSPEWLMPDTATVQVPSWQGPLPDVWFGAIVIPQGQPAVLAGVVDVAAMNGGPTTVICNRRSARWRSAPPHPAGQARPGGSRLKAASAPATRLQ